MFAPLLAIVPKKAWAFNIDSIYEALPGMFNPPSPVLVPRRSFADKAFAISLLRSGYETLDDLDCYPMDVWQRDFWLRRQAEWEAYRAQYEPLRIKQGDFDSNVLYFDFVVAMQFATVDHSLREPKQRFSEFCGDECGESQYHIVTRDGRYSDDARLPQLFADNLGQKVYAKLRNLGSNPLPISLNDSDGVTDPTHIATSVLEYFQDQGFFLKSEVLESEQDTTITIKTTGAATLWALQYLVSRGSLALPLYDTAVIRYLLKERLGISSTVKLVSLSDTSLTTQIRLLGQ